MTLWTPGGDIPVNRNPQPEPTAPSVQSGSEEEAAQLQEMISEMVEAPAEAIIATHAVGLFELARIHLSVDPPQLDKAKLAIDAFGVLVEGLAGRLGPDERSLSDGLSQLRMAFVQISNAKPGADPSAAGNGAIDPSA